MIASAVDVLVVGAGPAGSTVALEMARAGCRVLILESRAFPRDKPCGDCVSPGGVRQLERLGLAARLERSLRPAELRGWRIEAPDGRSFRGSFAGTGDAVRGWAVRRRDLDAALLREAVEAGARVRFGLRVFDLMRRKGRVVGVVAREGTQERRIEGRFVVGADGLRSVVRRRLGCQVRAPRLRKLALVGHLTVGGGSRFGELRVRDGRVCGFAPVRSGANVSLVVPATEAARISGDARGYMLAGLDGFGAVRERVRAQGLEGEVMVTGPFDVPVRRPWAPGALLVGDAAGYYDPFTGQGIYRALSAGRWAADAVGSALSEPGRERRVLGAYESRLRREFGPGRCLQRVIEGILRRPGVMSYFVGRLSRYEPAARRLLRVVGDLDPVGSLLEPGFWAGWIRAKGGHAHT